MLLPLGRIVPLLSKVTSFTKYGTICLPVLCGCETGALTFRKEQAERVRLLGVDEGT